jgi:hypothetical protein
MRVATWIASAAVRGPLDVERSSRGRTIGYIDGIGIALRVVDIARWHGPSGSVRTVE